MSLIELIGTIVGGIITLLVGYKGLVEKHIDRYYAKKKEYKKQVEEEVKKQKSIEGLRSRGEIRRTIEGLIKEYNLIKCDVLRFHNSGYAMAPINSKLKVTIEYELLMESKDPIPGLKRIKHEWQAREIDSQMERFIEDMLIDKLHHLKDIGLNEPNNGIRKIYNSILGKEMLFIEIGFVGYDYLVMAIQRERSLSLLSEKNKSIIEYYIKSQAENILKMIKSTIIK